MRDLGAVFHVYSKQLDEIGVDYMLSMAHRGTYVKLVHPTKELYNILQVVYNVHVDAY